MLYGRKTFNINDVMDSLFSKELKHIIFGNDEDFGWDLFVSMGKIRERNSANMGSLIPSLNLSLILDVIIVMKNVATKYIIQK